MALAYQAALDMSSQINRRLKFHNVFPFGVVKFYETENMLFVELAS